MYCAKCGAQNPDDAGRCVQCGADFDPPDKSRGWSTCGIVAIVLVVVGVVLVGVVGILAAIAIAVPNYQHAKYRARIALSLVEQRAIGEALEAYRADHGRLPAQLHALTHPVAYIGELPGDPFQVGTGHFRYWTDGDLWIVTGYGPDERATGDLRALGEALAKRRADARDRWTAPRVRDSSAPWH